MTTFLLIRHGETDWNREKVFRGRKDIPLSDNGREQAHKLGAALANEPIAAIYASPLSRAADTAAAIAAGRNINITYRDELLDMDFGDWEGLALEEVQARYPEQFKIWEERPQDFPGRGGESLAKVRNRAAKLLNELTKKHPTGTVALVTHRVLCKLLICEVLGLDNSAFWKIQQDVCCLNAFSVEAGRYVLLKMNETGHLQAPTGEVKLDF